MIVAVVIGDGHENDYNLFDTPLLDSSLRNDLRDLNDFFNDPPWELWSGPGY